MKRITLTLTAVFSAAALLLCQHVTAQDGLNGELDDLLGLGEDSAEEEVEADAEEAAAAEEAVEQAAEDAVGSIDSLLDPVEDNASEEAEETSASDEEDESIDSLLAPAEEETAEEAAEDGPAAEAEEEETPAEAAPAAEEEAPVEAVPVEEEAPAAEEETAAAEEETPVEEEAPAAEEETAAAEEAPATAEEAEEDESLESLLAPDEPEEEALAEEAQAAEEVSAEEPDDLEAVAEEVVATDAAASKEPAEQVAAPAAEEPVEEESDSLLDSLMAPVAEEETEEAVEEPVAEVAEEPANAADKAAALLAAPVAEEEDSLLDSLMAPVKVEETPAAEESEEEIAAIEEGDSEEEIAAEESVDEAIQVAAGEAEVEEEAPVAAAVAAAEPASPADTESAASVSEIDLLELMRRKALDEHGKKSLLSAQQEMKNGNYIEAQRLFEEASKFLTHRPENEKLFYAAEAGVAEAIYRQAEVLYKRGDLEGALKLARQAREHNHRKSTDLIGTIQNEIENPPEEKVVEEAKRWNDREYRKNREQTKVRLKRARQYLITSEFDKARTEIESILRDNPYDSDAKIMLKRIADRAFDNDALEYKATRGTMLQQVEETWTPRFRYVVNTHDLVTQGDTIPGEGTPVNHAGKTPEEETEDKMRKITIPEINFKGATISEVIEFFVDASREYDDPQIPPEQRGVNLILKIAQSAAQEAELEEDSIFSAPSAASDNGIPPVTFSARYMSLWNGLQYACELSRLKFRLRGNTVMIMPINEADVDMISRTYTVLPAIEERASSMTTSLSERSTDDKGRVTWDTSDDSASSGGVDWKQLFEDMGVKWPNGSSVKYLPSINKMRVFNTPENLIEFEKALQELNVTPRQVEIEARFVEVAQTDLESLGFEWLLTDDWEIAKNKKDPQQHIKINAGSGTASANRHLNDGINLGNGISIPAINDAVLSVSSVLTNPELGFVLHLLSQQANTDLLSAPKVVTKNNEEAIIKVVREYIYPTEYEIKENDLDSSSGDSDTIEVSYPSVEPKNFEMREVGVTLQVTPNVSEDGQLIDLQLNPQIVSEPEWKDYGFDYPIRMSGENFETLHLTMEQPIFKVRSVSTKISIYNGATVVMGGMITEERNEVNDKVPFLGDIPLIGRLFRSTFERSDKRNLLIFVTARMVDPAGRTLKTNASDSASVAQ